MIKHSGHRAAAHVFYISLVFFQIPVVFYHSVIDGLGFFLIIIITKLNITKPHTPTIKKGIAIAANLTFALWMETVTLKMSSTRLRSPLQPRRKHTSDFVALLSN